MCRWRKNRLIFSEQCGSVGHVVLMVEYDQAQLVIVVVFVFMVILQVLVIIKGIYKFFEVIALRYKQFCNVAAAKAIVGMYVMRQGTKLFIGFAAG